MKKRFLTLILAAALCTGALAAGVPSIQRTQPYNDIGQMPYDVDNTAWYVKAARYVLSYQIMDLDGSGAFLPLQACTREEVADAIYQDARLRAMDITLGGVMPQVEVAPDMAQVAQDYINGMNFCLNAEILGGDENGALRPKSPITRQELAAVMERYCIKLGFGHPSDAELGSVSKYVDQAAITWARNSVAFCHMNDIMRGDDQNYFHPESTISRVETAQILYNLDNKIAADWSKKSPGAHVDGRPGGTTDTTSGGTSNEVESGVR